MKPHAMAARLRDKTRLSEPQTSPQAVCPPSKQTATSQGSFGLRFARYKEAKLSRVPSVDDHDMLEDDDDVAPTLSELEELGDPEAETEDKTRAPGPPKCSCMGDDMHKPDPIPTHRTDSAAYNHSQHHEEDEDRLSQAWSLMTTYERVDWDRPELLQAERPPPTRAQQIRDFARRAVKKLRELRRQQPCRGDARGFTVLDSPRLEGRVGA